MSYQDIKFDSLAIASPLKWHFKAVAVACVFLSVGTARAANDCVGLPDNATLKSALSAVVGANGGFNLPMWATVVNQYGVVCAVASSGEIGDAWLNSRVISAQKAYTANGFSLPGLAIATANLFTAVQPGGSLYGLQHSNPVDPRVVYRGDPTKYGSVNDPMVGLKPGGINVFGGGLALYSAKTIKIGAVGVSGDSSCADHNIAWKLRAGLAANTALSIINGVPSGLAPAVVGSTGNNSSDNAIYDPANGFAHAACSADGTHIVALPALTE